MKPSAYSMSDCGKDGTPDSVIQKMSQEMLDRHGRSTRSHVSGLLNTFRQLGFITYDRKMEGHSSLLNIILRDSIRSMIQARRRVNLPPRSIRQLELL